MVKKEKRPQRPKVNSKKAKDVVDAGTEPAVEEPSDGELDAIEPGNTVDPDKDGLNINPTDEDGNPLKFEEIDPSELESNEPEPEPEEPEDEPERTADAPKKDPVVVSSAKPKRTTCFVGGAKTKSGLRAIGEDEFIRLQKDGYREVPLQFRGKTYLVMRKKKNV